MAYSGTKLIYPHHQGDISQNNGLDYYSLDEWYAIKSTTWNTTTFPLSGHFPTAASPVARCEKTALLCGNFEFDA